jgi:hypothetical protein
MNEKIASQSNPIDQILALIPNESQLNDCLRYYGKQVLAEKLVLARKKLEELKATIHTPSVFHESRGK